jgi:hypothetical protein
MDFVCTLLKFEFQKKGIFWKKENELCLKRGVFPEAESDVTLFFLLP